MPVGQNPSFQLFMIETLPSRLTCATKGLESVVHNILILGRALTKISPISTPLKSPRAVSTKARTFADIRAFVSTAR